MGTSEKGLLMLSLLLMPRLIPTTWVGTMVDTMALDTMAMVDTLDIPIGDKLDLECQIKKTTCPNDLPIFFSQYNVQKQNIKINIFHTYTSHPLNCDIVIFMTACDPLYIV